jgi:hypothetical protein
LVDHELDEIGKNDRAAPINMAAHIELTRIVLQENNRSSWQHIWREEISQRVCHVTKAEPGDDASPIVQKPVSTEPLEAISEIEVIEIIVDDPRPARKPKPLTAKSPFFFCHNDSASACHLGRVHLAHKGP